MSATKSVSIVGNALHTEQANSYRGAAADKVRDFITAQCQQASSETSNRLPPMRKIAKQLGVSLGTVQATFRKLNREGIICTDPYRSSYIRLAPERPEAGVFHIGIDFLDDNETTNRSWRTSLYGGMLESAMVGPNRVIFHNIPQAIISPKDLIVQDTGHYLDGLILAMQPNTALFGRSDFNMPMAWLSNPNPTATSNFVCADMYNACRNIGEAFRLSGRKRIFYVAHNSLAKAPGFHLAFAGLAAGLGYGNDESAPTLHYVNLKAFEDQREFLRQAFSDDNTRPQGIFCQTDHTALWVLRYLNELGIKVPGDVSVIAGTGLMFEETEFFTMTRVFQPITKIGTCLIEQLLALIKTNTTTFPGVYVPCHIGGGSTTLLSENKVLGLINTKKNKI